MPVSTIWKGADVRGILPRLIFIAVLVSGIYILPNVTAKFSGGHTMEINTTNGLDDNSDFYTPSCGYCHEKTNVLQNFPTCTECHGYILNELNATANSRNVLSAHTPPEWPSNSPDSDVNYACIMCHHPPRIDFSGTHTKVGIVACTYCHGNSTDPGVFNFVTLGEDHISVPGNRTSWIGIQLASPKDAHSNWFTELEKTDSIYPIPGTGTNFTNGFYTCMACHTHLEMNMRLERPKAFNVNITSNISGSFIEGPVINYSSSNVTYARRSSGSVWR